MPRFPPRRRALPCLLVGLWLGAAGCAPQAPSHQAPAVLPPALAEVVASAPPPVERARIRAEEAAADGDGAAAIAALRARVGEAPDDGQAWAHLVAWSARWPGRGGLDAATREHVLAALDGELGAKAEAARAGASAWHHLAAGDTAAAAAALGDAASRDQAVAAARLRLAADTRGDVGGAARTVLGRWPADREACEAGVRDALRGGRPGEALETAALCRDAGLSHPPLERLVADTLDLVGQADAACAAYLDSGAVLHAALLALVEGSCGGAPLPPEVAARAAADPGPEAALLAAWTWVAAEERDPDEAPRLRARLAGRDGPPFRAAAAAVALAAGDPAGALDELGGLRSTAALALRARALAAAGDREGALAAVREALARGGEHRLALHRLHLALAATPPGAERAAAEAALLAADPVALALAADDRLAPWSLVVPEPWPETTLGPEARERVALLVGDPDLGALAAAAPDHDSLGRDVAAVRAAGAGDAGLAAVSAEARAAWERLERRAAEGEPGAAAALARLGGGGGEEGPAAAGASRP